MSHESWTLLDRPMFLPHECIVTKRQDDPEGFVDCQTEIDGLRVAIAVDTVRRLAAFTGINDQTIVDLRNRLAWCNGEIADLTRQLETANTALDAVSALKRTGRFTEQRQPGRPRTKVAATRNGDED